MSRLLHTQLEQKKKNMEKEAVEHDEKVSSVLHLPERKSRVYFESHVDCPICGKTFLRESITLHAAACGDASEKKKMKKKVISATVIQSPLQHQLLRRVVQQKQQKQPKKRGRKKKTSSPATTLDVMGFSVVEGKMTELDRNMVKIARRIVKEIRNKDKKKSSNKKTTITKKKIPKKDARKTTKLVKWKPGSTSSIGVVQVLKKKKKKKKKKKMEMKKANSVTQISSMKRKASSSLQRFSKKKRTVKKKFTLREDKYSKSAHRRRAAQAISAAQSTVIRRLSFLPSSVLVYSKYAPQLKQSERELPSHNAANDFVKDLSIQYEKSPRLLQRFFYVLREFARKSISVHAVMNQVANLLGNRLDFMIRFNRFLPDDYWMEDLQQFARALEDRNKEIETKRREAEVASMVSSSVITSGIASTSGVAPTSTTTMAAATTTTTTTKSTISAPPMIQFSGYTTNEMDMTRARIFVKRIEDHFRRQPQSFKEFLEIVTSADAGFLECHDSMSKVKTSIKSVRAKIKSLIGTNNSNDLFDTFLTFLPETSAVVRSSEKTIATTTTTTTATTTSSARSGNGDSGSGENKAPASVQVS